MCVAHCLLCKQSIPQSASQTAPFTQRGHRIVLCTIVALRHNLSVKVSPSHLSLHRRGESALIQFVIIINLSFFIQSDFAMQNSLHSTFLISHLSVSDTIVAKQPPITHFSLLIQKERLYNKCWGKKAQRKK